MGRIQTGWPLRNEVMTAHVPIGNGGLSLGGAREPSPIRPHALGSIPQTLVFGASLLSYPLPPQSLLASFKHFLALPAPTWKRTCHLLNAPCLSDVCTSTPIAHGSESLDPRKQALFTLQTKTVIRAGGFRGWSGVAGGGRVERNLEPDA